MAAKELQRGQEGIIRAFKTPLQSAHAYEAAGARKRSMSTEPTALPSFTPPSRETIASRKLLQYDSQVYTIQARYTDRRGKSPKGISYNLATTTVPVLYGNLLQLLGGPHLDVAVCLWLLDLDDIRRGEDEQLEEEGSRGSSRSLKVASGSAVCATKTARHQPPRQTLLATCSNSTGLDGSALVCSCRTRTALRVFLLCRLMLPLFCETTLSAPAMTASCSVPRD